MKTKEEILNRLCDEDDHSQSIIDRAITLMAMKEYADQFRQPVVIKSVCECDYENQIVGTKNGNDYCYHCDREIEQTVL